MSKNLNIIYVVAFCLTIFTPAFVSIYEHLEPAKNNSKNTLEYEKRELTAWPNHEISKRRITDYTAQINSYFEDRFLFRKDLLNFAILSRFALLKLQPNQQGMVGNDEWLFLNQALESGLSFRAKPRQPLSQWADNALEIKKRVERQGGTFVIMIPPDKAQLYPEKVPNNIDFSRASRLLNNLKPLLEQRNIITIDLLDHLLVYKGQPTSNLLYSKTDTHWTHRGALRGYQKVVSELNSLGVPLPESDLPYLRTVEKQSFSGDIATLLGLSSIFSEPLEILSAQKSYKVFSPQKKLLVFGDSFSGRLASFWRYSFKEAHCYHHNIIKPNLDLIEQVKADVVILQVVERSLSYPLVLDQKKTRTCF